MKKQEIIDKTKFPYEIGTRVSVKSPYIKKLATIVGISYNPCACMQYEIKFDGEDVVIHYPTDLMILATTETMENKYPSSYLGCCDVLGIKDVITQGCIGYKSDLLTILQKLLICRNAYWKIASKEMGLDAPWELDWNNEKQDKYGFYNEVKHTIINPAIFVFPTEEMRDIFYRNFKDLIEKCKELL